MPDLNDLARRYHPKARDIVFEALGDLPSVEVPATVVESSEDGVALVDFGGEAASGDDSQYMEIVTGDHLEEGDEVFVSLKGGTPVGVTNPGWGDKVNSRVISVEAVADEAAQVATDASSAASEAASIADAASSAASDAQGTAEAAQESADKTRGYFWADSGGAHVATSPNMAHEQGAGYNLTLGATDTTTGIILDHDDQTLASFTPSALDFYADGQLAAAYTRDGVGLYAPDEQDNAQQVAAFTKSGVSFYDAQGTGEENVIAAFGADGAVIGPSGGEQVVIANGQLSLVDEGEVVAYVNGQSMGISDVTVSDGLHFGGFAWIPRSNGNLALKWMGVTSNG